jgi:hypothetical protein
MSGKPSRYERVRAHKAGREDALAGRPWEQAQIPTARAERIYLKAYAQAAKQMKQDFKTIC